jgi:hypothetical protein
VAVCFVNDGLERMWKELVVKYSVNLTESGDTNVLQEGMISLSNSPTGTTVLANTAFL